MTRDTDSDSDAHRQPDHGTPRRDRVAADLSPTTSHTEKYGQTDEGTADPDTIQNDDIREAVEEARRRRREQHQEQADADTAHTPPDDTAAASDDTQPAEPVEADPPQLKNEPDDPDEFFEDELGDPRREMKEARAKGLHRDDAKPADSYNRNTDTDTPDEDTTMSDNTSDTDSTATTNSATIEDEGAPVADYGSGDPDAEDETGEPQTSADGHEQQAAATDADGGAPQAEQVEPLGEEARDHVDEAFGEDGSDDEAEAMPDIDSIDFEEQDIEGASEDRGEELIEMNDCYFVLEDVDDDRAENLLNALQDESLDAQDRFDVIIDTVITKPSNAAARVANWKYLHRATLAGRCMEHCGLDDVVDFPNE